MSLIRVSRELPRRQPRRSFSPVTAFNWSPEMRNYEELDLLDQVQADAEAAADELVELDTERSTDASSCSCRSSPRRRARSASAHARSRRRLPAQDGTGAASSRRHRRSATASRCRGRSSRIPAAPAR